MVARETEQLEGMREGRNGCAGGGTVQGRIGAYAHAITRTPVWGGMGVQNLPRDGPFVNAYCIYEIRRHYFSVLITITVGHKLLVWGRRGGRWLEGIPYFVAQRKRGAGSRRPREIRQFTIASSAFDQSVVSNESKYISKICKQRECLHVCLCDNRYKRSRRGWGREGGGGEEDQTGKQRKNPGFYLLFFLAFSSSSISHLARVRTMLPHLSNMMHR